MIYTVKDLIAALEKFKPEMPICIRRGHSSGGFNDWKMHNPTEFYPGGKVCIMAVEPWEEEAKIEGEK